VPRPGRDRSLQDALRARREQASLLSLREVREREAARKRAEEEARERAEAERKAAGLVARQRETQEPVDRRTRLAPAVYAAVLALEPDVYFASSHWRRVARAQRAAAPECEVAACERRAQAVERLDGATAGEERPQHDLVSLCDRCRHRSRRAARSLGRPLTRAEATALDPAAPLYDREAIAELRARYDLA